MRRAPAAGAASGSQVRGQAPRHHRAGRPGGKRLETSRGKGQRCWQASREAQPADLDLVEGRVPGPEASEQTGWEEGRSGPHCLPLSCYLSPRGLWAAEDSTNSHVCAHSEMSTRRHEAMLTQAHRHARTHKHMYVCTCIYEHACLHAAVHTHGHACTQSHACTQTCLLMHTHAQHTHTCTAYTHTPAQGAGAALS